MGHARHGAPHFRAFLETNMIRPLIALATAGTLMTAGTAHAGNVQWSIGVALPPVATIISSGPAYAPAPYYAPAPVYAQAPVYAPAPVYVEPAPVYYAPPPVVYRPWYGHGHRWHHRPVVVDHRRWHH
jgi:hypothetical protein